jgi:diguanylate cyclase (GGDEF)-like protein
LAEFRPAETLCFPVLYEGVALGVIVLASSDNFGPKQRALAEFFSHGFGLPLNKAFAHERLEKLAALDPLTGVYNRGFGLGRLHEEFERAVRASSHLGVLMMDIDFFKAVNDTYGHLVGDRVLKAVASSARSALRQGDVLLRYGGEEFLAVLPAAPSDDLAQVGERIRRAVADIAVPEAHQIVRVTLSLGGVALQDQGVEREASLLELADAALYQAKQTGRDKVQIVR